MIDFIVFQMENYPCKRIVVRQGTITETTQPLNIMMLALANIIWQQITISKGSN